MLLTEWNMADALDVRYEEGMATGEARGEARGVAIGEARGREEVFALLRQGYSIDEAEGLLAKREPELGSWQG